MDGGKYYVGFFVAVTAVVTVTAQQTCELTTRDVEGPFFIRGAPSGGIPLAPEDELANPKMLAHVGGRLLDENCDPLSKAQVHIWHAGGTEAHYTDKKSAYLWYRGVATTDDDGKYNFVTTFPSQYSGRPIRHYHFRVETDDRTFVTQMYFRDFVPDSYTNYVRNRDTQFPLEEDLLDEESGKRIGRRLKFDMIMYTGKNE